MSSADRLAPLAAQITVSTPIERTPRALQVAGIFDLPPTERSEITWDVALPLDEQPWNVGLIVGPSGSGKSTIARRFWPKQVAAKFTWPADRSVLDAFPAAMSVKQIVELLSSVGFSSPPSWMRPYRVLSTGEQFRVTMARVLAEQGDLAVVDEFTSVVDRTVACIGASAIAKTVRRQERRFIAVTCHEDVLDWLQPDWVYRPATQSFEWRRLRRRPDIELEIRRVHHSAWQLFGQHHYLSNSLNPSATCFIASWRDRPVAFTAWLYLPSGTLRNAWRCSRAVCLPDYQGAGIGNALLDLTASVYRGAGHRAFSIETHPALIRMQSQSPNWRQTGKAHRHGVDVRSKTPHGMRATRATLRLTAGFEYVGPAMERAKATALLAEDFGSARSARRTG